MIDSSILPLFARFHSKIARLTADALINCGRAPTTVAIRNTSEPTLPQRDAKDELTVRGKERLYAAPFGADQSDYERSRTPTRRGGDDVPGCLECPVLPLCRPRRCSRIPQSSRRYIPRSQSPDG